MWLLHNLKPFFSGCHNKASSDFNIANSMPTLANKLCMKRVESALLLKYWQAFTNVEYNVDHCSRYNICKKLSGSKNINETRTEVNESCVFLKSPVTPARKIWFDRTRYHHRAVPVTNCKRGFVNANVRWWCDPPAPHQEKCIQARAYECFKIIARARHHRWGGGEGLCSILCE